MIIKTPVINHMNWNISKNNKMEASPNYGISIVGKIVKYNKG